MISSIVLLINTLKWSLCALVSLSPEPLEIIDRILFLGGLPNLQEVAKLHIGENVKEILEADLKIELDGVKNYKEAIAYSREVQDFVSEDLFKKILADEEGHGAPEPFDVEPDELRDVRRPRRARLRRRGRLDVRRVPRPP